MRVPVRMWEPAQEGLDERAEEPWRHYAGLVYRVADLLLMMPFFGVFAGDVEPVFGYRFTGPGHGKDRVGFQVLPLHDLRILFTSAFKELGKQGRAHSFGGFYPIRIQLVQVSHQIVVAVDFPVGRCEVAVAVHGYHPDIAVEQMCGNVADFPQAGDGRFFPIFGREGSEQRNEVFVELGKQVNGVDHGGGMDLFGLKYR